MLYVIPTFNSIVVFEKYIYPISIKHKLRHEYIDTIII